MPYASDAPKRGVGGGCHGKWVLLGSVLIGTQKGKHTSVYIANVIFHHNRFLIFRDLSRAQMYRGTDEVALIGVSQEHNNRA